MTKKPELIKFDGIPKLTHHKYERYLPTAFDESLSILEKINRMIYNLELLGELTNEMIEKWNEIMDWIMNDGLEDAVNKRLQEWLEDGTLERIINELIFGKINDKLKELEELMDELRRIIAEEIDRIGKVVDEITGLKMNLNPIYHTTMESFQQSVTQSFIVRPDSTIYNIQAQVTNPPDSERHATVNRLNRAGLLIDYMEVLHSGHGADWKILYEGGREYLVFTAVVNGQYRFAKMVYEPYARIDVATSSKVSFLPKFGNENQLLSFDVSNDRMAIATLGQLDSGDNVVRGDVKIYKYSEYMQGINAPIKTFPIENDVFQGFDLKGERLFIYYSRPAPSTNSTSRLIEWNTKTDDMKTYLLNDLGQDPSTNEVQETEGEGVFIWEHPQTHEISVFICMATGFAGGSKRVRKLYGWHGMGNWQHFSNIFNEKVQGIKSVDADSYSLTQERFPSRLQDFTTYGEFYLRGSDVAGFSDFPSDMIDVGSSGWWVINDSKSKGGAFYQRLKRNTTTDKLITFERIVHTREGKATKWIVYSNGNEADKPPRKLTKLSDLTVPGQYYFNTDEWKALTDVPTKPVEGYGTSGFFVTVSRSNGSGDVFQRADRNSELDPVSIMRAVQVSQNKVQPWYGFGLVP